MLTFVSSSDSFVDCYFCRAKAILVVMLIRCGVDGGGICAATVGFEYCCTYTRNVFISQRLFISVGSKCDSFTIRTCSPAVYKQQGAFWVYKSDGGASLNSRKKKWCAVPCSVCWCLALTHWLFSFVL